MGSINQYHPKLENRKYCASSRETLQFATDITSVPPPCNVSPGEKGCGTSRGGARKTKRNNRKYNRNQNRRNNKKRSRKFRRHSKKTQLLVRRKVTKTNGKHKRRRRRKQKQQKQKQQAGANTTNKQTIRYRPLHNYKRKVTKKQNYDMNLFLAI